jgi:uncharacterized SAM-binding protein YcdF (DUF218 family)
MKKNRSSLLLPLLFITISGFALATFSFHSYLERIPSQVYDETTGTDAIVVLTGSAGRIDEGILLIKQGLAAELFISGVSPIINLRDLVQLDNLDFKALPLPVSLGTEAKNTRGNAIEINNWIKNKDVQSIRLVTSAYHMPRSLKEIKHTLLNIQIIPHPVFSDKIKMDWWSHPSTASVLAIECIKYLTSSLRIYIEGWFKENTHSSNTDK